MVPPVVDVCVFIFTVITHGKLFHYSPFPVIGKSFYNRISWPAVRTVDKGITVSAIRWIVEFGFTLRTHGNIRRNESRSGSYAAASYRKPVKISDILRRIRRSACIFCSDRFDLCHRRRGRFQFPDEMLQIFRISLKDAFQPCGGIAHPAADMIPGCKPVKKRPKSYALYDSFNFNANGFHDCAFLICSAIKSESSCMPSPVRLLIL